MDFLNKGNTQAKYIKKASDCLFSNIQYTSFQSVTNTWSTEKYKNVEDETIWLLVAFLVFSYRIRKYRVQPCVRQKMNAI